MQKKHICEQKIKVQYLRLLKRAISCNMPLARKQEKL